MLLRDEQKVWLNGEVEPQQGSLGSKHYKVWGDPSIVCFHDSLMGTDILRGSKGCMAECHKPPGSSCGEICVLKEDLEGAPIKISGNIN